MTDTGPPGDASRALVESELQLPEEQRHLMPDVAAAMARLARLQEIVHQVLVYGEDYGPMPGVKPKPPVRCEKCQGQKRINGKECADCRGTGLIKPPQQYFAYKSGCEKLCEVYGYAIVPKVEVRNEQWDRKPVAFFHYETRVELYSLSTGKLIASGLGSCNSMEKAYRWRRALRTCPKCNAAAILPSKFKDQAFWCNRNAGGCGYGVKKGSDEAKALDTVDPGLIENDDICSEVNNILKKSYTRALRAATLAATRSSAVFPNIDTDDDDAIEAESRRLARDERDEGGTGAGAGDEDGDAPARDPAHPNRTVAVTVFNRPMWTAGADGPTVEKILQLRKELGKCIDGGMEGVKKLQVERTGSESSLDLNQEQAVYLVAVLEAAIARKPLPEKPIASDDEIPFPTDAEAPHGA